MGLERALTQVGPPSEGWTVGRGLERALTQVELERAPIQRVSRGSKDPKLRLRTMFSVLKGKGP